MVVGFTNTCAIGANHHQSCEFEHRSWRCVLDTTLCDKVFFSFGHCIVCSSLSYSFWLIFWYLQTFSSNSYRFLLEIISCCFHVIWCLIVSRVSYAYSNSKLWVRTPFMTMCTRYNIMWYSSSVTCDRIVVFFWVLQFPPTIKPFFTI
jgi:hypothetical protein